MTKCYICPTKTLTFWNTLTSKKIMKLGMGKSGFTGSFLLLFPIHSYQFVQTISFLADIGDLHQNLQILFHIIL